jgi:hypothetical protein
VVGEERADIFSMILQRFEFNKSLYGTSEKRKLLKKRQVKYARSVVRRMHPLRNLPLKCALPIVNSFSKNACDEEKQHLKNHDALDADKIIDFANQLAKFGVVHDTDSESDDFELEEGEDPLGRLGAGIISYFTLLRTSFCVLGLAALATFTILIKYRALDHNVT